MNNTGTQKVMEFYKCFCDIVGTVRKCKVNKTRNRSKIPDAAVRPDPEPQRRRPVI